jgi:hypothetical protein
MLVTFLIVPVWTRVYKRGFMAAGSLDLERAIRGPGENFPAMSNVTLPETEELLTDDITVAIQEDDLPDAVLKAVLTGLAEEQSSLKDLRQKRSREGKDTSYISLKRGTLLKFMSETLLQRQALAGTTSELDLRGPKFREVFKMFLGIISETFEEIKIPAEYKEMFFHALSRNLEGWEGRAEKIVKAMTPKI